MTTPQDTLLRSLDAARPALDDDQRRRASALLERIVASPATGPVGEGGPGRRVYRRAVVATGAVAAVVAGMVLVQGIGGSGTAYASWTPTPTRVSAHDLAVVARACRAKVGALAAGVPGEAGVRVETMTVALAERRGDFVAVLLTQDNPDTSASCIARSAPGSAEAANVQASLGGTNAPAYRPAAGRITWGSIAQFAMGTSPASFADGTVGPGVVGVTVHAGSFTAEATVANGRFAAWWPGKAFTDDRPPREIVTYDVRLGDGTILTNVAPDTGS